MLKACSWGAFVSWIWMVSVCIDLKYVHAMKDKFNSLLFWEKYQNFNNIRDNCILWTLVNMCYGHINNLIELRNVLSSHVWFRAISKVMYVICYGNITSILTCYDFS